MYGKTKRKKMESKETWALGTVITIVVVVGILALASLLFTGCVLNNECIIQYGPDDSMQQEQVQEQEGSLEATLNPPQVKVSG